MKLYNYGSNIIRVSNGKSVAVIAPNKKEALNFAKEFEGLIIGNRMECYTGSKASLSIKEIMRQQTEVLDGLIKDGKVRIEK